jgi:acetyl esterase/lipase
VEDIKAAIRYLRANADKYGIDANAVAVWGESAGGYLATMVGVTNHSSAFDAGANLNQSSEVQGVIDDFGASDISKIAADFDAVTQHAAYSNEGLVQYIGKAPDANSLDAGIATTVANPLKYTQANAPPFLIFHGNQDRMVSPGQTLIMHDALVASGVRSARYVVDGAAQIVRSLLLRDHIEHIRDQRLTLFAVPSYRSNGPSRNHDEMTVHRGVSDFGLLLYPKHTPGTKSECLAPYAL